MRRRRRRGPGPLFIKFRTAAKKEKEEAQQEREEEDEESEKEEGEEESGVICQGTFGCESRVHSGTFGYIRVHSDPKGIGGSSQNIRKNYNVVI